MRGVMAGAMSPGSQLTRAPIDQFVVDRFGPRSPSKRRSSEGPILLRHDGDRLDTRTAYRWVRAVGRRAGRDRIHPHTLRAAFLMAALD